MWVISDKGRSINVSEYWDMSVDDDQIPWRLRAWHGIAEYNTLKTGTEAECRAELRRIMVALAAGVAVYEVGKGAVIGYMDGPHDPWTDKDTTVKQEQYRPIILLEEASNG